MIKVGQKVLFIPHFMELQGNNSKAIKQEPVIATVFMVNPSREMFFVRWKVNGVTLRQGLQTPQGFSSRWHRMADARSLARVCLPEPSGPEIR